jgi:hypothetical protein
MKVRVITLAASMWVASFGCALAQATASPAPDPHPEITARAKDWLHRLQTNDIDRAQFDDTMNAAVTPQLAQQTASQLAPLGAPLAFKFLRVITAGDLTVYIYEVTFTSRKLDEQFALDKDGKIAGIMFVPPQ